MIYSHIYLVRYFADVKRFLWTFSAKNFNDKLLSFVVYWFGKCKKKKKTNKTINMRRFNFKQTIRVRTNSHSISFYFRLLCCCALFVSDVKFMSHFMRWFFHINSRHEFSSSLFSFFFLFFFISIGYLRRNCE